MGKIDFPILYSVLMVKKAVDVHGLGLVADSIGKSPRTIRRWMAYETKMSVNDCRVMEQFYLNLYNKSPKKADFTFIDLLAGIGGLIRQLTNFPPDIMIEKWIYDRFPMLRVLQLESIKKQHAEAVSGLTETVRKITPYAILFASNVMNYAFFRILGLHIGQNFTRQYSSTIYIGKGKELAAMTEKEHADSHEGDNIMIDKWASFLNISDWFKWRGFEDVPPDYGKM